MDVTAQDMGRAKIACVCVMSYGMVISVNEKSVLTTVLDMGRAIRKWAHVCVICHTLGRPALSCSAKTTARETGYVTVTVASVSVTQDTLATNVNTKLVSINVTNVGSAISQRGSASAWRGGRGRTVEVPSALRTATVDTDVLITSVCVIRDGRVSRAISVVVGTSVAITRAMPFAIHSLEDAHAHKDG